MSPRNPLQHEKIDDRQESLELVVYYLNKTSILMKLRIYLTHKQVYPVFLGKCILPEVAPCKTVIVHRAYAPNYFLFWHLYIS